MLPSWLIGQTIWTQVHCKFYKQIWRGKELKNESENLDGQLCPAGSWKSAMLNISQNMIMLRRPWDTTRPSALPSPPGVGQQSPFKPAHWGLPQSQTLQQRQHPSDAIPSKAEGYNFVDAQSSSRFLKTETRHNDCFQKQFLLVGPLSHWPLHITHAFIFTWGRGWMTKASGVGERRKGRGELRRDCHHRVAALFVPTRMQQWYMIYDI